MLSQLQQAFKSMIGESDWTDRVTQRVISEKVDAIGAEIGYPNVFGTPDELDKLYAHVRNIPFCSSVTVYRVPSYVGCEVFSSPVVFCRRDAFEPNRPAKTILFRPLDRIPRRPISAEHVRRESFRSDDGAPRTG